jgi:two-component system, NtrC family, response regulator AtoC
MLEVLRVVQRLMDTEFHMAITGETGTGKEAIARMLHFCSRRKEGPFVAVNGSAITETLLESEFFGHEKGSFTGATSLKRGLFEEARNGTLFIDEIGDMPMTMQAKLLRVLQEGEFRRVGGTGVIHSNARVIAATNRDLTELVKQKQFREDLYYRIRGAEIHLPPLRARTEDILPLALFFLRRATAGTRKKIRGFSPEAIELMKQYSWVGNVRQLRNEVERIAALSDNTFILPSDFDEEIRNGQKPEVGLSDAPPETLREMERQIILKRLQAHDWNINRTARSLGVTRNGLYSKMKLYNLPREMRSE